MNLVKPLIRALRWWRDYWRLFEGPELEPRFWHSHFLSVHYSKRALSNLGSSLEGKVIDIGAGTGHGARYLNPSTTDYFPTDLPSGRSPLDASISRIGQAPLVHCSIYDLPFAAASFDGAILLNVLEHLATPTLGLAEVKRVLRPEGRLLFCVPFAFPLHGLPDDYRRWTGQGLRQELEMAGFELLELRSCGGTFASLAININLCLRYETPAFVLFTPFLILIQGLLNSLALLAERLAPQASALPLAYAGLARRRAV